MRTVVGFGVLLLVSRGRPRRSGAERAESRSSRTARAHGRSPALPASTASAFAAEELRRYVQQIERCELPLELRRSGGPAIVVGVRADLAASDRDDLPPARRATTATRSGSDS